MFDVVVVGCIQLNIACEPLLFLLTLFTLQEACRQGQE
jgi:hypothetical protein